MNCEVTAISSGIGSNFASVQLTQTDAAEGIPAASMTLYVAMADVGTYVVGQSYAVTLTKQ